jgi:hypothetical protein
MTVGLTDDIGLGIDTGTCSGAPDGGIASVTGGQSVCSAARADESSGEPAARM